MDGQQFEENLQLFFAELKSEDKMTEKQRNILAAAIKLFADKGYFATSTSEIAKEAGVAEGTIFRHYKTKKDVLIAAVAPFIIKLAAPYVLKDIRKILTTEAKKPLEEVVSNLYRNRLELIEQHSMHLRMVIQEAFFHPEIREVLLNSLASEGIRIAKFFIEQKVASGELRSFPPEILVRSMMSLLGGMIVHKYLAADVYGEWNEEEQITMTVDILLHGIVNR